VTTCEVVQERLPDYLYEVLPEWEGDETEEHIAACRECAQARDEMASRFGLAAYDAMIQDLRAPRAGSFQFPEKTGLLFYNMAYEIAQCRTAAAKVFRANADVHSSLNNAAEEYQLEADVLSGMRTTLDGGIGGSWNDTLEAFERNIHTAEFRGRAADLLEEALAHEKAALEHLRLAQADLDPETAAERPVAAPTGAQPSGEHSRESIEKRIAKGEFAEAIEDCRAWVRDDPQGSTPHLLLGGLYARLGHLDRSVDAYETALDLNPALIDAHLGLADAYKTQGLSARAAEACKQALALDDKCIGAYRCLTYIALDDGKTDDARLHAEAALGAVPDSPISMALCGEVSRQEGDLEQAKTMFGDALERDPKCADALFGLAATEQTEGLEDEAQAHWDAFLEAELGTQRAWLAENGLVKLAVKQFKGDTAGVAYPMYPTLSPNGSVLAFTGQADPKNKRSFEVYLVMADGSGKARPLTSGGGAVRQRWSPDGSQVFFDFYYKPEGSSKCAFVVRADGTTPPRCLAPQVGSFFSPAPVPGTDWVVYSDISHIIMIHPDSTGMQIAPIKGICGEADWLSVSPDGKSVLFAVYDWRGGEGPAGHLYVAPLEGGTARKITSDDSKGRWGSQQCSWGPLGKRIIFVNDKDCPKKGWDLYAMCAGDKRPPVKLPANARRPSWSPDGTQIWFDRSPRQAHIYTMQLGGKRLRAAAPEAP